MDRAALLITDMESQLIVRQTALECAGFECALYASTDALVRGIKREDRGLILVDTDSPAADCQALATWRRNWFNPDITLIAIGADDPHATSRAFDAGVDDFVPKPVRGVELLARLAAATRRRRPQELPSSLSVAGCSIDRGASAIVSKQSRVKLTARDMALAQLLFENAGRNVTRERLARDVWGLNAELSSRSIDQHIYQLRRKLKRCAGEALALRGIYGNGYRIDVALDGTVMPSRPVEQGFDAPGNVGLA